jgi:hypothetical protein
VDWFLWSPPPATTRAALEELAASRHKRPGLNHIFIVPCLYTLQWRRLLYKKADVVFKLPAGVRPAWPLPMHEPLVVGLTLHFAVCPPFQLRFHPPLLELVRTLHGLCHMCRGMKGLFCANFATPRLHWSPCKAGKHGRCYTPHPDDHFYCHQVADDDGFDWQP